VVKIAIFSLSYGLVKKNKHSERCKLMNTAQAYNTDQNGIITSCLTKKETFQQFYITNI